MNKKVKHILILIAVAVIIPFYIFLASNVISDFVKPAEPFSAEAGGYKIVMANGETDPDDEKENRIFDLVNKNMLYSEHSEFENKQLISLYRMDNGGAPEKADIKLEISEDLYKDDSVAAVTVDGENLCHPIKYTKTEDEDGKYYMEFSVDNGGLYGFVALRGKAEHAGLIVLASLTVIVLIYFFAFMIPIRKKKGSRKDA